MNASLLPSIPVLLVLLASAPAHAIGMRAAFSDWVAWEGVNDTAFDNDVQTDDFGSEDATTTRLRVVGDFGNPDGYIYHLDCEGFQSGSQDLTPGLDVGLATTLTFRIQLFGSGFQRLSRVDFTGANLTRFELDESGATYGYPSLEFDIQPVEPALSVGYPTPSTARFGATLRFDAAFDGDQTEGQTVVVTDIPRQDLWVPDHPSTAMGMGIAFKLPGIMAEPTSTRFFFRETFVNSLGGATFDHVQGAINGRTPPDGGFAFHHLGTPASLGVTYDLGAPGENYRAYDLQYHGWDGSDDIQVGYMFAPRDQDSDGLPDGWEQDNGFDETTPDDALNSDGDKDRQSAYDEFLQGTDPNDSLSRFYVTWSGYDPVDDDYSITWASEPDREYEFHYWDPNTSGWMMVPGTSIVPGDAGATTSYTIPDAKANFGSTGLFRVGIATNF